MNASRRKYDLPMWELAVYYILNVLCFGSLWVIKLVIKKAILEAKDDTTN